jgi:cytochrome c-type biogenesis protein CcmI
VLGVVLLALLVVLAVLFVVVPLLRTTDVEEWKAASAEQLRRIELRERRDNAYVALRELELDHDTGKLDDADYAAATAELRAEAVAALAALEEDEQRAASARGVPTPPDDTASEAIAGQSDGDSG